MPFTSSGCILYHLLSIVVPCSQTTNIVLQEMHGSYSLNNVFVETKCKSDSIACLHVKLFHTYTISALSWYLVLPISLPPNRVCKPKWHRHYPSVGLLDRYIRVLILRYRPSLYSRGSTTNRLRTVDTRTQPGPRFSAGS